MRLWKAPAKKSALGLNCRTCSYSLMGISSRVCPECRTLVLESLEARDRDLGIGLSSKPLDRQDPGRRLVLAAVGIAALAIGTFCSVRSALVILKARPPGTPIASAQVNSGVTYAVACVLCFSVFFGMRRLVAGRVSNGRRHHGPLSDLMLAAFFFSTGAGLAFLSLSSLSGTTFQSLSRWSSRTMSPQQGAVSFGVPALLSLGLGTLFVVSVIRDRGSEEDDEHLKNLREHLLVGTWEDRLAGTNRDENPKH